MTSYRDVPVLVTGATGFIGRRVALALADAGAKVAIVVRNRARLDSALAGRARVIEADLTHSGTMATAVAMVHPSITFNLAGYGVAKNERDDVTAHRVNMLAVGELIEALSGVSADEWDGARLVQAGSGFEYGAIDEPLDENAQALPTTTYGQTKLAATTLIHHARAEGGLPSVTARLFTIFGPGEREGRLFPTLADAAPAKDRIPLTPGTQSRDWVYVDDAAKAMLALGLVRREKLLSELHPFDAPSINLASGNLTSVRDFAIEAAKALGITESRLGFGDLPQPPEKICHPAVPVGRLKAALGWLPPVDPASGLARAAAAVRK